MRFTIAEGLTLDVSHLYGPAWAVTDEDIEEAEPEIREAAEILKSIRETGKAPAGETVRFPRLLSLFEDDELWTVSEKERLTELRAYAETVDAVISVGIGGSYLGNRVLCDACSAGKPDKKHRLSVYFAGYTADPEAMGFLLSSLKAEAAKKGAPYRVLVISVSKSGTTIEPAAALSVLLRELPHIADETRYAAVTDRGRNILHGMCHENDWLHFYVPEGIGGRFSVLSQVGMIFATAIGLDTEKIFAGARAAEASCQSENPRENPAFFLALLKYLATMRHGIATEITMPYGERLCTFAQWYAQLLGESLGKKNDWDGNVVHYGRTPVCAIGTTDMHSVTQEHQEGKRDKILQFISVLHPTFDTETEITEDGKQICVPMSVIHHAALYANAEALACDKRMSVILETETVDEYHLGALFYFFELAIAYEGALAHVNAYDQPGVEKYKTFLHGELKRK